MLTAKKGPTFTAWLNDVDRHFKKHGMDSALYVLKKLSTSTILNIEWEDQTSEHYLPTSFGQVNLLEISAFDEAILKSSNSMDQANDRMGYEFLRGSVCIKMKRLLDQELPVKVSAAKMLWTIIHKVQGVNSTAVSL